MTLEDKIQQLLAEALPYRPLDEDDPKKEPLARIVDEINRLRAAQAKMQMLQEEMSFEQLQAEQAPKRGPGRPPKARIEGQDA
jgi:hypothetical protein